MDHAGPLHGRGLVLAKGYDMNQVITDGLILMPPAFADGLGVWSRQDGRPGSDTWATAPNAAIVAADSDFGDCLEILKIDATTKKNFYAMIYKF